LPSQKFFPNTFNVLLHLRLRPAHRRFGAACAPAQGVTKANVRCKRLLNVSKSLLPVYHLDSAQATILTIISKKKPPSWTKERANTGWVFPLPQAPRAFWPGTSLVNQTPWKIELWLCFWPRPPSKEMAPTLSLLIPVKLACALHGCFFKSLIWGLNSAPSKGSAPIFLCNISLISGLKAKRIAIIWLYGWANTTPKWEACPQLRPLAPKETDFFLHWKMSVSTSPRTLEGGFSEN